MMALASSGEKRPSISPTSQPSGLKRDEERPIHGFFDKTDEDVAARNIYLKIFLGGSFMTIIIVFSIFSIFWGAIWKTPVYNLPGWIVVCHHCYIPVLQLTAQIKDFDGGLIGQGVVQALTSQSGFSKVSWRVVPPSQFPGGLTELAHAVLEEKTWVAISGLGHIFHFD